MGNSRTRAWSSGQGVEAHISEREFVNEIVEGGAEVVETVPDDETEPLRGLAREI
jgi:hypothetical protein